MTGVKDDAIIELFWQRNDEAITLTDRKYGKMIFTVCHNILHSKQDSEECQNSTYMKLWNAIPPEKPFSLKSFAARVARLCAIDRLRKDTRKKRVSNSPVHSLYDLDDAISSGTSVSDEFDIKKLAEIINGFLSTLSKDNLYIFVMSYYFCEKQEKIANNLSISRRTLNYRLSEMKKALKELLRKEGYLL